MTQHLMLLDSASLYFRAFYGVPDQRRDPGEPPTNAVRGFLDMIATLVAAHHPTHLVACWDNDWRPAFRVNAIATYKTHRLSEGSLIQEESPEDLTPQVPLIMDALQALGIARIGSDGYEADDVIGTLTHRAGGKQMVDVVTGDRDLFQLVDDDAGVRVLYTARGGARDPDVVTQAFLQNTYSVSTGQAYADLATLRRALADGDPQIKGAQRKRLEAASADLDVAPVVVQVALNAPIPDFDASLPRQVGDLTLLSSLASGYGLTNNLNRVLNALGLGDND